MVTIESESFPVGSRPDMLVTNADVEDGMIYVEGVLPGNITMVDSRGYAVFAPQRERVQSGVCVGVYVDLGGFLVDGVLPGTWKIRFARGERGPAGTVDVSSIPASDEILMHALIFG